MKNGIAYIRVSKARANMITQDTQLEKIEQYCSLHDIELLSTYMDLDFSGRSTNRPDFQKLFYDIENDNIDVDYLLVYKLDRFARSVNDFHEYMDILDKHDINFVSITQHFDTSTPMGRLVRNILVDFAQFESEMVGERVRDNMLQNAQNGVWNGGPVPLGFSLNEDEKGPNIIPNGRAKDIIKFYNWYLESDGTIRNNSMRANKQRIPSSTGSVWNPNQMSRILKNPIYCIADKESIKYFEDQGFEVLNKQANDGKRGFIRYNRRKPTGTTSVVRDKSKWLIAVAEHEGIVPSELYIKAQKKRDKRKNKPVRAGTGKSLLAWLTKCSKCGRAMTYSYSYSKLADGTKKRYNYYKCRGKQQQGTITCEGQTVKAEQLEKVVLNKLHSLCNDNDFLNGSRGKINSLSEHINQLKEQRKEINSKINQLISEEENLINTLKRSNSERLLVIIEEKVEELNKSRLELEAQLEEIQTQLLDYEAEEYNKQIILSHLRDFNNSFDSMSFEEKREFLQSVINKIIYNEGDVKLELFFS